MNMHLSDFLAKDFDTSLPTMHPVICFVHPQEYPLYFFSCLTKSIKAKQTQMVFSTIQLADSDISSLQAQLNSSFLGLKTSFWCGDLEILSKKTRAIFLDYLVRYQGPNQCLFYLSEPPAALAKEHLVVTCEAHVDKTLFEMIMQLVHGGQLSERDRHFISKLYAARRKISLDAACLMSFYVRLFGSNFDCFSREVLDHLIIPENSLFTLAQHFFAHNEQAFFKEWQSLYPLYPDLFWISFWSDQLWRAYHYVRLSKSGQPVEAKHFARRLPFSFINYDWKRAQLDELNNMLAFVYDLDSRLKNGMSGQGAFELLFLLFNKKKEKKAYEDRKKSVH